MINGIVVKSQFGNFGQRPSFVGHNDGWDSPVHTFPFLCSPNSSFTPLFAHFPIDLCVCAGAGLLVIILECISQINRALPGEESPSWETKQCPPRTQVSPAPPVKVQVSH